MLRGFSALRDFRGAQRSAIKSVLGKPETIRALGGLERGFQAIGTPTLRGALGRGGERSVAMAVRSGKRRSAVIGSALALNAAMGPNGSKSTGGRGTLTPRSIGGYA
jgi:hypothetical protein